MSLKPYLKYLFEVVAIVVGITLSFMVDEWREDKQNREELVGALKIINKDLASDSSGLFYLRKRYQEAYEALSEPFTYDHRTIISNTIFMRTIEFKTLGFEQLNKISKVKFNNDSIAVLLSDYYNFNRINNIYGSLERTSYKFRDFYGERLLNMEYIYYSDSTLPTDYLDNFISVVSDKRFSNYLFERMLEIDGLIGAINRKSEKNKRLKELIEVEIDN